MRRRLALFGEPDLVADFVGLEAEGFWPSDAGQDDHVVQFFHRPVDAEPVDRVAALAVDDVDAAAGVRAALGQLFLQRQALKRLIVPCLRETDDRVIADQRQSARKSGTERHWRKRAP